MSGSNDLHNKTIFGFWVYLMTDLIMFGVLFAAYAVLHDNTFGGPSARDLFSLNGALAETLILLTSSFTCGLAMLAVHRGKKDNALMWFAITLILGFSFLAFELNEFLHLFADNQTPQKSAFLTSFFTLVGTHGLHITVGLLWMIISMFMIHARGLTSNIVNKLIRLSMYWHFLDLVWIFIFTIVYLMGASGK
jgi:cytochrome o ubiquinol oxidase subunit 3